MSNNIKISSIVNNNINFDNTALLLADKEIYGTKNNPDLKFYNIKIEEYLTGNPIDNIKIIPDKCFVPELDLIIAPDDPFLFSIESNIDKDNYFMDKFGNILSGGHPRIYTNSSKLIKLTNIDPDPDDVMENQYGKYNALFHFNYDREYAINITVPQDSLYKPWALFSDIPDILQMYCFDSNGHIMGSDIMETNTENYYTAEPEHRLRTIHPWKFAFIIGARDNTEVVNINATDFEEIFIQNPNWGMGEPVENIKYDEVFLGISTLDDTNNNTEIDVTMVPATFKLLIHFTLPNKYCYISSAKLTLSGMDPQISFAGTTSNPDSGYYTHTNQEPDILENVIDFCFPVIGFYKGVEHILTLEFTTIFGETKTYIQDISEIADTITYTNPVIDITIDSL